MEYKIKQGLRIGRNRSKAVHEEGVSLSKWSGSQLTVFTSEQT